MMTHPTKLKSDVCLLKDHVGNRLDKTEFPYVREAPSALAVPAAAARPTSSSTSLRSQKPAWHRAPKPGQPTEVVRPRIMVFIFGGMTYSEIREAYLLSSALNKDIYIGTGAVMFQHFLALD
jgi:syntaxin-binding protein 1